MESIQFLVQGSAAFPYEVTFSREGNTITAFCSCPAGDNGTHCKHRHAILSGQTAGVVSNNVEEVVTVTSWLPGSNLAVHFMMIETAEQALERAKQELAQAKKALAVAMRGSGKRLVTPINLDSPPPNEGGGIKDSRKRIPFKWISFSEVRDNGIAGYADGWFFWVHKAFKPALDIYYTPEIDKERTATKRDEKSLELFGVTHDELKKRILKSGEALGDSDEHKQIMAVSHKESIETEGSPLFFSFRQTDALECRSGEWYVQVTQATPATEWSAGSVGFQLFVRNHDTEVHAIENPKGIWCRKAWFSTTQRDFVDLLKGGRCSVIDLENPIFESDADNP